MEKTIKEWFEELPEPYKTQVLTNCKIPDEIVGSKLEAIAIGFLWSDTPEGEEYWHDVFLTLEAAEFDEAHEEEQQWEAEQENNTIEHED